MKRIYYEHALEARIQPAFSTGEAGPFALARLDGADSKPEVWISPNSRCALLGHGVGAQLNALPGVQGQIGSGLDAVFLPGCAEPATQIFYDADQKTYGQRYDFVAKVELRPEPIEYRVVIDNREYQRTLSRLQFMASRAARQGLGLRIRL